MPKTKAGTLLVNLILPELNDEIILSSNPYLTAAYLQAVLVWIHPWGSANGRTLRHLSAFYLIKKGLQPWALNDENEALYTKCHQDSSPALAALWEENQPLERLDWDQFRKNIVASREVQAFVPVLTPEEKPVLLDLSPGVRRALEKPFSNDLEEEMDPKLTLWNRVTSTPFLRELRKSAPLKKVRIFELRGNSSQSLSCSDSFKK